MTAPEHAHDYTAFAEPLAHPGEHLREDFLPDYGLTPGALARAMGLKDRTRIERLVREHAMSLSKHIEKYAKYLS